jgi:hypothetical protein
VTTRGSGNMATADTKQIASAGFAYSKILGGR